MLRYGYNRTIATGTITASGTLAQAIPPSLVLIVLADQLGKLGGDMYAGALRAGPAAGGAVPAVHRCWSRVVKPHPGCRRCRPEAPHLPASPTVRAGYASLADADRGLRLAGWALVAVRTTA
jgi:TRAP-type C4-dicarboxylate transport system permease large subunit